MSNEFTISLAGNPNCGKSALFNALTGIHQKTGNWPGVTVERKEGRFKINSDNIRIVDLPGIYSLDTNSMDEHVTRDFLLSRQSSLIVNIVDAANLERNLYLTTQILEMGFSVVVVLNMMDVARKRGIKIDSKQLGELLGCPVIELVATTGEGLPGLKQAIDDVHYSRVKAGFPLAHDDIVEQAIAAISPFVASDDDEQNKNWLALKILENDQRISAKHPVDESLVQEWQSKIEQFSGEDADIHIADSRYGHAHSIAKSSIKHLGRIGSTATDYIDSVVLNRFLGVPFFLFIMYLMFMFTINIGGAFIDFFDQSAAAVFVDGFGNILDTLGAPAWLHLLVASGIGGGLQIVATFIPIITALYLFLSFIEDSGYMARAAFVMDRFMRSIGLPGKAFVPLIVGFGCNVPAVMATRTLENERERKLTILMNPFMSCGARLPVYALFSAAFFPTNGQNLVFLLYIVGILVAVLTGMIMKRSLLSGASTGFMLELPSYHMPTLKGVALHTWDRVKHFISDAGKTIVVMVILLNVLNSVGIDGSLGNTETDNSLLAGISQKMTPAFAPMGIHEDNWPAVLGIVSGVLAKEVVVSTLDTLYSKIDVEDGFTPANTEQELSIIEKISVAVDTIPENLSNLRELITDPLALNIGDVKDTEAFAQEQDVDSRTFGAMITRFDGQAGAFAYLLFILLYFPCVATVAAIKRETGTSWATFVSLWTTGIAYAVASGYYQIATFSEHPLYSISWITGTFILLAVVIALLRTWAAREINEPALKRSAP